MSQGIRPDSPTTLSLRAVSQHVPGPIIWPARVGLVVAAIVLVSLGACGRDPLVSGGTVGPRLDGRTFLSQSVEGHPLVPGTQIRLSFTGGNVGAQAGCNSLGAPYAVGEDGRLAVRSAGMIMTEIACDPDRDTQDRWLEQFLQAGPTIDLDGDDLILTAGAARIRLLDREVADPDRPLVGPTWIVDTVITGEVASSAGGDGTVTLRFPDEGHVVADARACTSVAATVNVGVTTLTFDDFVVDSIACPGPWAATLEVLDAGETEYAIDDSRLTITTGDRGISATADNQAAPTTTTMTTSTSPTPGPGGPPACSAARDPANPQRQPGLPSGVADLRAAIVAAAVNCDYDALASLMAERFTGSFGGGDAIARWRQLEESGEGEPLHQLVALFDRPFATRAVDDDTQYVWPSAYAYDRWDDVPAEDRAALRPLYDEDDFARFAQFGSYLGYRIGITPADGWTFFVGGD